ncbi:MAG: hypothetical protein F6K28_43080 [Microcoleus sp. SIO2G3]|nr:hypothetical protein [Microcoleus sp. SIO2G3]
MNHLTRSASLALFVSIAVAASSYLLALSLLLPITDASAVDGGGPDADTQEWQRVIAFKTARRQALARNLGILTGAIALPASFWLMQRRQKRE